MSSINSCIELLSRRGECTQLPSIVFIISSMSYSPFSEQSTIWSNFSPEVAIGICCIWKYDNSYLSSNWLKRAHLGPTTDCWCKIMNPKVASLPNDKTSVGKLVLLKWKLELAIARCVAAYMWRCNERLKEQCDADGVYMVKNNAHLSCVKVATNICRSIRRAMRWIFNRIRSKSNGASP